MHCQSHHFLSRKQEERIPTKTQTYIVQSEPCPKEKPRSNHLQSLAKPHTKRSKQPRATFFLVVGSSMTLNLTSLRGENITYAESCSCSSSSSSDLNQSFGKFRSSKHSKTACLSDFQTPSFHPQGSKVPLFLPESIESRAPRATQKIRNGASEQQLQQLQNGQDSGLFCRDAPLCQEVVLVVVLVT